MSITPLPTPTAGDLAHLESCDSSVRLRRLVEIGIVRHLVAGLVSKGHTITVDDGCDEGDEPVKNSEASIAIIDAAFAVDECYLFVHPPGEAEPHGWVRLIFGNGADCLVDYTTNLDALLKPTNDYAEALSAWF
jgi:hypothetical protein